MFVYLDDIRFPKMSHNSKRGIKELHNSVWTICRNFFEFELVVNQNLQKIQFVSFDHDINSFQNLEELTGLDASKLLIDRCIDLGVKMPDWFVHSDNPSGNLNIRSILSNYMIVVDKINIVPNSYGVYKGKSILSN